jgi:hypothetical protein
MTTMTAARRYFLKIADSYLVADSHCESLILRALRRAGHWARFESDESTGRLVITGHLRPEKLTETLHRAGLPQVEAEEIRK